MRRFIAVALLAFASAASAQSVQLHGFLTGRAVKVDTDDAGWAENGFGRFDVGGDRTLSLGVAQLGVDWTPTSWLLLHADGLARETHAAGQGKKIGLVQAYVDVYNDHWRLRAGHFWLPASRENIDPMWNSRYTITYSALNSWIGQEVRPVGADLQYSPNFYITLGATAFQGNDTMGTLLSARGWTLGNRLTVYDEVLPAPPDTTRPFGSDLDGAWGFSERIRLQLPERAMIQFTHVDNRAELDPGEVPDVPWLTPYDTIGATIGSTSPTTFAAEWARGKTTVGFPGGTFTLGFDTAYALVSHKSGANRVTLRAERFNTDFDRGRGLTFAWLRDIGERVRAGAEYVRVSGDRPGTLVSVELRYSF